jgi:hypothetical protein
MTKTLLNAYFFSSFPRAKIYFNYSLKKEKKTLVNIFRFFFLPREQRNIFTVLKFIKRQKNTGQQF